MHQAESHVLETKPESLALKNFQYPRHRRSQPHKVNAAAEIRKQRPIELNSDFSEVTDRAVGLAFAGTEDSEGGGWKWRRDDGKAPPDTIFIIRRCRMEQSLGAPCPMDYSRS